MTIQDYCTNEKCALIKMPYEYIFVHEDKYIISRINKKDKIDIKTMQKRHWLAMIVLPIFIIIFLFIIWKTIVAHDYFFFSLYTLSAIFFSVEYFYLLFKTTGTPIIPRNKVIEIFRGRIMNCIYIKFRDNNNKIKIRGIACSADKHQRELTFQLLKEYNIL